MVRYQGTLAVLAQRALEETDLQPVLDECVRVVAGTLDVEYSKILELEPDGGALRLRAGVGWKEGCVGHATVSAGIESQAGFTLLLGAAQPLIVDDVAGETRFALAPLLRDHEVASGMSVVVPGPAGKPFGVLGAHTSRPRRFTPEEASFLRTIAGIVSAQIVRTQAEQEGRRARAAAEDADRAKDRFFAVLGHELRNPLQAITNLVAVLERIGVVDPRAKQARAGIRRQVRHLARLIEDLFDVARVARGALELRRQPLDLGELVRTVVTQHAAEFEEKRQALAVEVPERRAIVSADADRLQQVIENLLANALKFTPPGGAVRLTLRHEDGSVALSVRDTGAGIPADQLQSIFGLFEQARSGEAERSGLGVGLALVRGIVEHHGGTVEAHSDGPGTGSEFVVRLPLADGTETRSATMPP
jgi:signal transduction histidine kinase